MNPHVSSDSPFPSSSPEIVPSWFAWYHRVWSISEANWSSSKFNVSTKATACWTELIWFCRQEQKVGLLELITRNEDDDAILNDWITWWWQIWIVGGPFINRPPSQVLWSSCMMVVLKETTRPVNLLHSIHEESVIGQWYCCCFWQFLLLHRNLFRDLPF